MFTVNPRVPPPPIDQIQASRKAIDDKFRLFSLFHSNFHDYFTLRLFLNSMFSDGALKSLEVNSLLLIFLHLGEFYHHYLILSSKLILHLEC